MAKKILIIEDDFSIKTLLESKLQNEGFEVATAENSQEGLLKIKKIKPDLILLDIILPGENGFEIAEKIRKDHNTPIIAVTNMGQKSDIKKGYQIGITDYIVKTKTTPEEILEIIRKRI